jgi:hypothetical protein
LSLFKDRFSRVFYVPGNHDLWTVNFAGDSLQKEEKIIQTALAAGVEMKPARVGEYYIVPLYGWYDLSFGEVSGQLSDAWQDFTWCRWPGNMELDQVTDLFLARNETITPPPGSSKVISFSHFLPRIDVMPSYIPEKHRIVYPVLGSEKLDQQLRAWGSKVHIYGHSHVNRNVTIDGVTYINNAFGYPAETRICKKELVEITGISGT